MSGRVMVGDRVYHSWTARAEQEAEDFAKAEAIRLAAAPKLTHVAPEEYAELFRQQELEDPERFRALQAPVKPKSAAAATAKPVEGSA
ncbi:MAG: hypothetical protein GY772_17120, partial [bacterium]|nr:hypothetical protein [bacterium]